MKKCKYVECEEMVSDDMKKGLTVVSAFDGMSCGQIAFERAGIEVDRYYASEVDKYAMQVTQHNYPDTIQLGDIQLLKKKQLKKLFKGKKVILIGGSPCQGFSLAGKLKGSATSCGVEVTTLKQYKQLKRDGFEFDGQSYLFWEYMRIMKIIKPKYFLLENVRVTKKWLPMFNDAVGVDPILINSALVSAQNRNRYYWTNIPGVEQPEDKGLLLKDIIDDVSDEVTDEMTTHGKAFCLTARYAGAVAWNSIEKKQRTMIATKGEGSKVLIVPEATKKGYCEIEDGDCFDYAVPNSKTRRGRSMKDKSNALLTSNQFMRYEHPTYRKLTPLECERLQTVPDNYTNIVSNSQRYKMLGNGWTVDVIVHILKGLK